MLGKRYDQPSNMGDETLMPGNAHISTSTKEISSPIRCDKNTKIEGWTQTVSQLNKKPWNLGTYEAIASSNKFL